MLNRKEIKRLGKSAFKANYWNSVLAVFLVALVIEGISALCFGPSYAAAMQTAIATGSMNFEVNIEGWAMLGFVPLILLAGPLAIGQNFFFVKNITEPEKQSGVTPFKAAFTRFGHKLGGYMYMVLFLALWSLFVFAGAVVFGIMSGIAQRMTNGGTVLIIIGALALIASYFVPLVKAYSYSMTPYILAVEDDISATEALKASKEIMQGHRWQLFVLELSFIGWALLGALTFGILNLFFVSPYMESSIAAFYLEVKRNYTEQGGRVVEPQD